MSFPLSEDTDRLDIELPRVPQLPRRRHSDVSRPSERLDLSDEATYELPVRPQSRPQSHSVSFLNHDIAPRDALALSRGAPGGHDFQFPPSDRHTKQTLEPLHDHLPTTEDKHIPERVSNWNIHAHQQNGQLEAAVGHDPLRYLRSHLPAFQKGHPAVHDTAELPAPRFHKETGSLSSAGETHPSDDYFEAAHGASDTTVDGYKPPVSHGDPPAVDLAALGSKLQQFKMQDEQNFIEDVLGTWYMTASETKKRSAELMAVAVEYDNNDLLGEVLDIWNEEAIAAEEERLEAEAAAEAAAQHQAYVAKMERRATRVYEIFTIRNVLAHWQDLAREEVDRTAVARRHIVRKRAFEGWRDQHLRDETKVKSFILEHTLKTWSQVALHHEVRHEVAVRWHEQQLCKQSLHTMLQESKERLADDFYVSSLVTGCLDVWAGKARDAQEEYRVAAALDERLLLDEAVNIWLEETEILQDTAYETTRQFLILGARRDLENWQEQARLERLLKRFNTQFEENTKRWALQTWHGAFQDTKQNNALADAFMVKEPVDHWEREMKLKLFLERDEYETKIAVLNRWGLEERLAWYKRHVETRTKRQVLNAFLGAARQARNARIRQEQEADYVDVYYTQTEVVDTWLAETDKMWTHQQNANLVCLYRTTKPCLDRWRERCQQSVARSSFYRRKADKHRSRSLVSGVLDEWPAIAETARRERMMTSLRQFRRKYKVELAQSCLSEWLVATADALDAGRDAHNINLEYKREDVLDCLDHWSYSARRAQDIRQIAADAELEVYCSKWQEQLHEAQDNMQDAVEYDAAQTRARCWERWEFQTLQQQSKRHMAATMQERNEKRFCRQILDEWQQRAVPEAAASRLEPRHSTLFRRSTRQQLSRSLAVGDHTVNQLANLPPRSASANHRPDRALQRSIYPPETPIVTVSQLGRSRGAESTRLTTTNRPAFRSLGPMPEFDEEPLAPDAELNDPGFMSTPTRWTGSIRALGYRPTTTPSAILASPYERELRRQYHNGTGGAGGVGGRQREKGVGFADISENSAEDLYG